MEAPTPQPVNSAPVSPKPAQQAAAQLPNKAQLPNLSTADAQALLTINNLSTKHTTNDNKKIAIVLGAFILAIIIALMLTLFSTKNESNKSANNNVSLPSRTNNPLNNGGSIKSQVHYCSNPVNAALVC